MTTPWNDGSDIALVPDSFDGTFAEYAGLPIEGDDTGFTDDEIEQFLSGNFVPTGFEVANALVSDAGEEHTGAMIALVPDAESIQRLQVAGGEAPEELHLTLCYLGEAAKIVPMKRTQLIGAMRNVAQHFPVVDAKVFGASIWNASNVAADTAIVLNVGGEEIDDIHEDVERIVMQIMEDRYPEQYEPWSPHICVAYSDDLHLVTQLMSKEGFVRFDRIRIAFAGTVTDIPLYDGTDVASEGDEMGDEYSDDDDLAAAGKKESDVNLPGGNHNLKNYWTHGPGAAKIGWGTDGSFARCVAQLGKYVTRPQGLCAEYHKAATGEWPTQGGKHGIPSAVDIGLVWAADTVQLDEVEAILADGTDLEHDGGWTGVLAVEDVDTGDQRRFSAGSITWPNPKDVVVPLQWAPANNGEHKGSVTVGRIHQIWRDASNPRIIRGKGVFDLEGENGKEAFRQVKDGFLAGTSIDPDQVTDADVELIYPTQFAEADELTKMTQKPEKTIYHAGRIRGATLVAFPAFIEGAIQLTSKMTNKEPAVTAAISRGKWSVAGNELALGDEIDGLVASAAFAYVAEMDEIVPRSACRFLHHEIDAGTGEVGPANLTACLKHITAINDKRTFGLAPTELRHAYEHLAAHVIEAGEEAPAFALEDAIVASLYDGAPPLDWFVDPKLNGPAPITITDDGRVFGHMAAWQSCHTSFPDSCVTPPREKDYSFFTTGEVVTATGERVAVGQITMGTSHAATRGITLSQAVDHYGNTGTAVADVAAGVDEHGIWVAGAVRPGTSVEHLHALRASALSGDWRRIGGTLRMVAVLAVNVPGFPIPRTSLTLNNERPMTLVAAGVLNREVLDFAAEIAEMAGSCGIPLGNMKKRKKMPYELELLSLQVEIGV
jgi:2'-5' RNA ligase